MNTKINVLYCHATGNARVSSVKLVLHRYETQSRVVPLTPWALKENIMGWLRLGHEVTIKSV